MIQLLRLAWRNIWRNWRRTAIALVAIVLGLILLLFMQGMIKGSDQAIYGNAVRFYGGNIQVHAPGFLAKAHRLPLLPVEDADGVVAVARTQPEVTIAAKRINTGGIVSNRAGAFAVAIAGIDPEVESAYSIQSENISLGRFLLAGEGDAIVIGKGLADLLETTVGDRVTLLGKSRHETMRQRSMTVVGIYDLGMAEAEKTTVFVTLEEAQSLYNLRNEATAVNISLQKVGEETKVVNALQSKLPGHEINSWDTLRPEIRQTIETKAATVTIFGLVVLLIASIGILNLMQMAVFERTREMGMLAALGMKGRQVMGLFLAEGALIGLVGAVVGCAAGWALVWSVGRVGFDISYAQGMGEVTALMGDRIYPVVTLAEVLNCGLAVVCIAALASLYPAWQASRREPADALHHV
jgi:ABC-type lipoprotein release transport system permease subunit